MDIVYHEIKSLIHNFFISNSYVPMCFQPHFAGEYISERVKLVVQGCVMLSICLLIEIVDYLFTNCDRNTSSKTCDILDQIYVIIEQHDCLGYICLKMQTNKPLLSL